jgi:hypothetical protein
LIVIDAVSSLVHGSNGLSWRFILSGAVAAVLLLFSLFLWSKDPTLYELFLIVPCVAVLIFILLLLLSIPRSRRASTKLLLATAAFIFTGIIGSRFEATLRPALRWALFSRKLELQVLSQTAQPSGTFKHVEWDGWGGAPVGDWTAYVVFDPADSLKGVAGRLHAGVVRGIPCDVLRIQRLGPRWYSVTLEVNEWWDRCRNE